jgi:hypothetical protein
MTTDVVTKDCWMMSQLAGIQRLRREVAHLFEGLGTQAMEEFNVFET